ncbi:kelch domain-containing protein 2-like isoform X2 [Daphnia pulicaria]|uniref:kelch domain-containing protein 2-like isoform X2 n=1 Tax=Daphnia pulicaria TaxID=35523 RepID=UPI001EECE253|nr:kelch domain-containing protein 2-like isoform X2 [Daphnia pulicaria]
MYDGVDHKLLRVGHVALEVQRFNGQLLLVWGGYMQNPTENTVEQKYHDPSEILLFDPVIAKWTTESTKGHIPPANSGACGVVVGDLLFIYGGYFGDPDLEGNSNNIYQLNLFTWIWTRLEPDSTRCKPLHRDKLIGWAYNNKVFFFGGFGTPPADGDRNADQYEYVPDRSHQWYMGRGWNNQLIAYNIDGNKWERPETNGQTPSPRAALAGFQCRSRVYVFGGRLQGARLNDLYVLDLMSMSWSENLNTGKFFPCGRSWHSFTYIGSSKAILYGGLSAEGEVMGDCWIYDIDRNCWTEMPLKVSDKRLWHQSVKIDSDWIVIGGVRNNIHNNQQDGTIYADNLLSVSVTPKTLLRCCVEFIAGYFDNDRLIVSLLPKHLQELIKARSQNSEFANILKTNS